MKISDLSEWHFTLLPKSGNIDHHGNTADHATMETRYLGVVVKNLQERRDVWRQIHTD